MSEGNPPEHSREEIAATGQNEKAQGVEANRPPEKSDPSPPPWWKFWKPVGTDLALTRATVWLVIATFSLAAIAVVQAVILSTTDSSTRKAADAAIKSATAAETALQLTRQEQRPIVWLTNDLGGPHLIMDMLPLDPTAGQIVWTWHYTNYGKTPALHVSFRHFMVIEGKRAESFGAKPAGLSGAPVPTGKDDFSSVVSAPGIKPEEYLRLAQTDDAIGVDGEITYEDAAGTVYRSTFCLQRLALGSIKYCAVGNDIK
jgi:hypothetical protein